MSRAGALPHYCWVALGTNFCILREVVIQLSRIKGGTKVLCIAAAILWEAFNTGHKFRIFRCSHATMRALCMHPCGFEDMHFVACVSQAASRSQGKVCTCSMRLDKSGYRGEESSTSILLQSAHHH